MMNRQEALRAGNSRYYTGLACKNGHVADRYAKSGACSICVQQSIKKSNSVHMTVGEMINRNSKLIYLFAQEENFPLIKMNLDCFVSLKFPEANPDHINPFPFKSVRRESTNTFRIRVRVPLEYEAEMLAIGKVLLVPDTLIVPPTPEENQRLFGKAANPGP